MYGSKKPINMKDDLDQNREDTLTRDVFATHNLCNKKIEKLVEEEKELLGPPKQRQVVWCAVDADICNEPKVVSAFAEGYFGELTDTKPTALTIPLIKPLTHLMYQIKLVLIKFSHFLKISGKTIAAHG